MVIIGIPKLTSFAAAKGKSEDPLKAWRTLIETNSFEHLPALKNTFGSADYVKPYVVFDIGGNKFRIVAVINYEAETVSIEHVFTHAEYDVWWKGRTKAKGKKR